MSQGARPQPQRWSRLGERLFCGFLLVALPAVLVLLIIDTEHFARHHESARGDVVDVKIVCTPASSGGANCREDTYLRFVTAEGRDVIATITSPFGGPDVGEVVTVYYDKDDPRRARLDSGWSFSELCCVAFVVGLWLMAIQPFRGKYRQSTPTHHGPNP
jgi:hypothetical protein